MPERSSKKKDLNQNAFSIMQKVTGEIEEEKQDTTPSEKNPAAVALGRLGGLKGGKARAEKLSGDERRAIATQAANARWKQKDKSRD